MSFNGPFLVQMLETEELLVFARIVATRSLSRAATELRMPRATVSRRLVVLETKLGVRLLRRTTRSMALTDAGRALLPHAQAVVDAAVQAEASVRPSEDQLGGDVRISVGPGIGDLAGVLADFIVAHPRVRLLAHVSNRGVDLRREDVDLAIRASAKLTPGLVARRLAAVSLVAVAAPGYLALHGTPRSRRELRTHVCLLGLDEGLKPRSQWPAMAQRYIGTSAPHSNDPFLLTRFCLRGLGIAFLPHRLVADHIARGELVPVLPQLLRVDGAISLVYAERKLMPAQVRALIDWIIEHGPAALRPA